jgi:flagellar P-ring protein precursor FlgI
VGNSKSLRGGTLLMSPLKGVDGQVYAIAQGSLMVSGVGAEGADGSSVVKNIPSVGRIPNGATVERSVPSPFDNSDSIVFNLNTPDFTTTSRMVESINNTMGLGTATAIDGSSIRVNAPQEVDKKVMFVSMLENLTLDPGEAPARVIINARTGTVVIGSNVVVMSAAVSHGSLAVTIAEDTFVSQPGPFSEGDTAVVARSSIEISEESGAYMIKPGITLGEIVSAVNRVGASPSDLMAVLDALKQAGALKAELIVM